MNQMRSKIGGDKSAGRWLQHPRRDTPGGTLRCTVMLLHLQQKIAIVQFATLCSFVGIMSVSHDSMNARRAAGRAGQNSNGEQRTRDGLNWSALTASNPLPSIRVISSTPSMGLAGVTAQRRADPNMIEASRKFHSKNQRKKRSIAEHAKKSLLSGKFKTGSIAAVFAVRWHEFRSENGTTPPRSKLPLRRCFNQWGLHFGRKRLFGPTWSISTYMNQTASSNCLGTISTATQRCSRNQHSPRTKRFTPNVMKIDSRIFGNVDTVWSRFGNQTSSGQSVTSHWRRCYAEHSPSVLKGAMS